MRDEYYKAGIEAGYSDSFVEMYADAYFEMTAGENYPSSMFVEYLARKKLESEKS